MIKMANLTEKFMLDINRKIADENVVKAPPKIETPISEYVRFIFRSRRS